MNSQNPQPAGPRAGDLPSYAELIDLVAVLNAQGDIEEIVRIITEQAAFLLGAENAILLLVNPRTRETLRTVNRQSPKAHDAQLHEIQLHTSGYIMHSGNSLLSHDLIHDSKFSGLKFKSDAYRSAIGIPIRSSRTVIGSIVLINKKEDGRFDEKDLDYLLKFGQIITPFFNNIQQLQIFFEHPIPESVLLKKYANLGLIGRSEKFIALLQAIEAAGRCDVRVMLQGPSGTGKELVARAIHKISERSQAPFVAIDCGAIPSALFESEMLGHVKGAFTGSTMDRKGLIEEADQGTLFMDEIVNLPMEMQSKLLRVLQEGEIRPVGGNKIRKVNVRVIAAASSSLEKRVQEGLFREDLFYRLYVYPIQVPSLQERGQDIALLAGHFLEKFAAEQHKKVSAFSAQVLEFIKTRPWPGNIRELENFIERLMTHVHAETTTLTRADLPPDLQQEWAGKFSLDQDESVQPSLGEQVDAYEANLIRLALKNNHWSQTRAARALKIPVQTLHNKMVKLKIQRRDNGEST
ncbi:sigma-54-dependent Fis family transcriptional regulator [bacterium]|nr:sigma-54-dependent Fis family transcriptional regulator [bacterium]